MLRRARVSFSYAFAVFLSGACGATDSVTRDHGGAATVPSGSVRAATATPWASATPAPVETSAQPISSAAPASEETIRYVALGDSFTIGTGSTPEDAFPARLVAEWSACPVRLTNLAKNGFTSEDLLTIEVPRLGEASPTFVTVAAGANDIVRRVPEGRYRDNIAKIFRAVAAAGVRPERTIALPQPDWSLSPAAAGFGEPRAIAARIERYNAILADEARTAGARYVDLFPLMRDLATKHEIASDGLHPSRQAHAVWAKALAAELGPCASFR